MKPRAVVLMAVAVCMLALAGCGPKQSPKYPPVDLKLRDAVFKAVYDEDFPAVRRMLEANPQLVNAEDNGTCLLSTVIAENADLAWWMLKHGARFDTVELWDNSTLLHWAAEFGTSEMAKWLLDKGIDPNRRDSSGDTPLAVAAFEGNFETVKLLAQEKPSDEDLDRAILNALLSLRGLIQYSQKLVEIGGKSEWVEASEAETKAAHEAARRKSETMVSYLSSRRRNKGAPFSFWKAAEGTGPDRMNPRTGPYPSSTVYTAIWKRDDGEYLVRLSFDGCSIFGTEYDVVVMDRTPKVVLQGLLGVDWGEYPYALVEVWSNNVNHPEALRGKWTLGVAYLMTEGVAPLDPNEPRVLVGWNQWYSGVNNFPVELIQWDNGPKLRYGCGNLSDLDDVKFRWAEPGPSIFTDPPKKPEGRVPSGR